MPVTTLNKVVAQLLAGAVMLALLFALHHHQIASLLQSTNPIVDGFLVLSLAALVGAIVDGLSELTVHHFIKKAAQSARLVRFLARSKEREAFILWRDRFRALAEEGNHYEWQVILRDRPSTPSGDHVVLAIIAGGFLRDAKSEEFQWLVQHYSGFTLLSSLAAVLGAIVTYVALYCVLAWTEWWWPLHLPAHCAQRILLLIAGVAALWVLRSYAASKWFYSYELAARHLCLMLAERDARPSVIAVRH